ACHGRGHTEGAYTGGVGGQAGRGDLAHPAPPQLPLPPQRALPPGRLPLRRPVHRSQVPGREHHHRPRRTLHTIVHLLHPTHTRHHIPSLDQDPVPGILQLPGNPLRPHPIHLGVRDKEVTPRPRDTTIHHRPRISRQPRQTG